MLDEIKITGLEIYANHGVYQDEAEKGQTFLIDALLKVDAASAIESDDIEKAVDYGRVCLFIKDVMLKERRNLIEVVADRLCRELLEEFAGIMAVEITVGKPQAPVPMKFRMISVTSYRERKDAYLSLGSNLGDKEDYLSKGIDSLTNTTGITMIKTSSIYTTKAYGKTDQPDFCNQVCRINTYLKPEELLKEINEIEKGNGRTRTEHWGPRTLDIDILLYGNDCISNDNLIIPHYDMVNRQFVLEPLCEIAPYIYHPIYKKNMKELLNCLVHE